jgi:uncharacterized integral membrane protein
MRGAADMKFVSVVVLMLLVFFAITFSLQNALPVTLKYYEWFNFQLPAYLLIFSCFFIGMIIAGLFGLIERFKLRRQLSRLKKEIKNMEAEIYDIRKLQIQNSGGPAIKTEYLS